MPESRRSDGTFAKGSCPNPGGRPKGIARQIRESTNDFTEMVEIALAIARDKTAHNRDRMQAVQWLADRGLGKAPETVLTGELPADALAEATALTSDQLEELVALARSNGGSPSAGAGNSQSIPVA